MFVIRLLEMGIRPPKSAQPLLTAQLQGEHPPQLLSALPSLAQTSCSSGSRWGVQVFPAGDRTGSLRAGVGGGMLFLTENGRDAAVKGRGEG